MFETPLVNLYSRDVAAALAFYRDRLGFEVTFRTPLEGVPVHVELELDGFKIGLSSAEVALVVHGVEASPGSPSMALVVWTDDVDESYRRLVATGVRSVQAPHDSSNDNRSALLRDPDGNLVELVAKRA